MFVSLKHPGPVGAQVTVFSHGFVWFFPQPPGVSLHTCALQYSAEYLIRTLCRSPEFCVQLSPTVTVLWILISLVF